MSYILALFVILTIFLSVMTLEDVKPIVTCPSKCTCHWPNYIHCEGVNITELTEKLAHRNFNGELIVKESVIGNLTREFLQGFPNMDVVDLSYNNIKYIEDQAFSGMTNLRMLKLDGNNIQQITQRTFSMVSMLTRLDLHNNELTLIPDDSFTDLDKLDELNLSGNLIHYIDKDGFVGLVTLRKLDLSFNKLNESCLTVFSNVPYLRALNLASNNISTLPHYAFGGLKWLTDLNLQSNKLTRLSPEIFILRKDDSFLNLTMLNLNFNQLLVFPVNVLSKFTDTLVFISLSGNNITDIPPRAFFDLKMLRNVSMSYMSSLQSISSESFYNLPSLTYLSITGNSALKVMHSHAFQNVPNLKVVDFGYCALKTISSDLLPWFSMSVVLLSGNPLICDCRVSWIPQLYAHHLGNRTREDLKKLTCSSPKSVTGQKVIETKLFENICSDYARKQLKVALGVSAIFLLIVVLMMLFWKYRKMIYIRITGQYRYKNCTNDGTEGQLYITKNSVSDPDIAVGTNGRVIYISNHNTDEAELYNPITERSSSLDIDA